MINVPIGELSKRVDNRYTLCDVVLKRSRQLIDGAAPLTECDSKNPVSIATKEVYEGKVTYDKSQDLISQSKPKI